MGVMGVEVQGLWLESLLNTLKRGATLSWLKWLVTYTCDLPTT